MYKVTVNIQTTLSNKETIMPTVADVCEHIQEALLSIPENSRWSITVVDTPITYREKI